MPSKSFLPPEAFPMIAERFKVMADPSRLRILHALQDGELTVSGLVEELEIPQPTVSKHLKLLEEAGFIARRQAGNMVFCSISDPTVFKLCELVCGGLRLKVTTQAEQLALRVRPRG